MIEYIFYRDNCIKNYISLSVSYVQPGNYLLFKYLTHF